MPGLACCVNILVPVLLGLLGAARLAAGEEQSKKVIIYAKENAPPTPKLEDLPLTDTVSQYGITWKFSAQVRAGQFVNGDYYVVGPVTVAAIDPKPLVGKEVPESELDIKDKQNAKDGKYIRNGSMLNQPARQELAYDSGIRNYFKPDGLALPPIQMKPGDALVSTVSVKLGEKPAFMWEAERANRSAKARAVEDTCPIEVAAVLTCLATPQPPDAFRPGYSDRPQKVYQARNLRRNLLPCLPRVSGAFEPVRFAEVFQKMWLNPGFFGFDQPMRNMPHYEQWICEAVGDAGLVLCMDFKPEEKEKLLIGLVQVGIDYWGLIKSGHPGWEGWGGHGSGRKFPSVFAGHLLGDEEMACPTKAFPKVEFGEDNQTRYGDCWTGAQVVFAGHSGIQTHSGKAERPHWGPYEHLPPSEWDKGDAKNVQSESYRRANTARCWVGEALALRILKLEKNWNHDPFLDYVDRWMYEKDQEQRKEIAKFWKNVVEPDNENHFANQGQTAVPWLKEAWNKYRAAPGMPPTDGWKQKKEGPSIPAEYTQKKEPAQKSKTDGEQKKAE